MRDAGGKPAERSELRLLHLAGEHAGVLEEHQHRRGFDSAQRREMRGDLAGPVRSNEAAVAVRLRHRVLSPGGQQIQQARRRFAEQCAGESRAVAKDFGGRFIDQADPVLRVHDEDALAEVLHDVLRQLREIGEIHFLAPHQRFTFAQTRGDRPDAERDQENDRAEYAGAGVVRGAGTREQLPEHLLQQHGHRGQRGDERGRACLGQQRGRRDGQREQDAEAAADATAHVHERGDAEGIHQAVGHGNARGRSFAEAQRHDQDDAGREIQCTQRHEKVRCGAAHDSLRRREIPDGDQGRRDQQPVQVQQPEDATGEVAGCAALRIGERHDLQDHRLLTCRRQSGDCALCHG